MTLTSQLARFRTQYNLKVDVYSFAITLAEMLCGFNHVKIRQEYRNTPKYAVTTGWRPKRSIKSSALKFPSVAALIVQCWDDDASKRPSFLEIQEELVAIEYELDEGAGDVDDADAATAEEDVEEVENEDEDVNPTELVDALQSLKTLRSQIAKEKALRRSDAETASARYREVQLELAELKATCLADGTGNFDDFGILGGMFIYDPDKARSVLGRGKFGTVYSMINPHDRQLYAVKELNNLTLEDGSTDEAAMQDLLEEVRKMGIVESEFVIQYRTSAVYDGRFYVMMEPIQGVEYRDVVVSRQATGGVHFKDEQIIAWGRDIALGLAHLHDECKLVHQDLHNGNVMITGLSKDGEGGVIDVGDDALLASTSVKILDLGLASYKSDHSRTSSERTMRMETMRTMRADVTRRGSFVQVLAQEVGGFKAIRAPEMHLSSFIMVRFDAKVDLWALGILLVEAALLTPIEE